MKTVIIYSRYSTSEQSKGYSLERQANLAQEFAQRKGWTVEKVITDEGKSAYHGRNRLEGSALHEFELEARNGLHRGKVLVVENTDRLSRQGTKAAAQLIWGLNSQGVSVATFQDDHIYEAEGEGDLLDVLMLARGAEVAYQESKKKSQRTSASWQKRFQLIQGGEVKPPVPNLPLWIDRAADGSMVLNAHRTAVLNEIYDHYLNGLGLHRIAAILNGRGEPSWTPPVQKRGNNGWFFSNLYRLLTKRTVLGEYVTHRGETLSRDFFPQAISHDKWNQVQSALKMRKTNAKRRESGSRNLLVGLVFCYDCGGGAHFRHQIDKGQTYTKVSGEVVTYKRNDNRRLRCDRARRKHQCDNPAIISYDVVEATLLDELLDRIIARPVSSEAERLRLDIANVAAEKENAEAQLNNLVDALAAGAPKAIVNRIAELEARIEGLQGSIEGLKAAYAQECSKPSNVDEVQLINSLRDELKSDDPLVQAIARGRVNMGLRRLIKRVMIHSNCTFHVETDDNSWWLFSEDGKLLQGGSMPYEPL